MTWDVQRSSPRCAIEQRSLHFRHSPNRNDRLWHFPNPFCGRWLGSPSEKADAVDAGAKEDQSHCGLLEPTAECSQTVSNRNASKTSGSSADCRYGWENGVPVTGNKIRNCAVKETAALKRLLASLLRQTPGIGDLVNARGVLKRKLSRDIGRQIAEEPVDAVSRVLALPGELDARSVLAAQGR